MTEKQPNQINLETEQDILVEVEKFLNQFTTARNTYCIIIRNDEGKVELHPRVSRPCYGEMRNYREKSQNRPNDRFPGDLLNNFPDGTPIGVAYPYNQSYGKEHTEFAKKMFGEFNPWLGKNKTFLNNLVHFKNGVLVNTGDISPTYLVATFMHIRNFGTAPSKRMEPYLKEGLSEKEAFLMGTISSLYNNEVMIYGSTVIHSCTNIERYLNQEPNDLDDGLVWADRCDYNRPNIMMGFVNDPVSPKNPHHFMKYSSIQNVIHKFFRKPEEILKAA